MKKQQIKDQIIFALKAYPLGVGFTSLFHKVQDDVDMVEFIAVLDEIMDEGIVHLDLVDYRMTSPENVDFFKAKRHHENLIKWAQAGREKFLKKLSLNTWRDIERAIVTSAEKVNQFS